MYKIKKRRGKRILIAVLIILSAIAVGVTLFIKFNVTPMIVALSQERIRSLTSDAVSHAVIDVLSENGDENYLTVIRDDQDNIKSVDIDGKRVSMLTEKIAITAQKYISEAGRDGIQIPVGSLSGISMFTGIGPDMNIKIYLVGSTRSQMYSEFKSCGINQTLHRLYFNIIGNIAVAVPGVNSTLDVCSQVVIGETLIVGVVPPTYLHSVSVGDMLDLAA